MCDDYNLPKASGVKKAIDEFIKKNDFQCELFCNYRFAKIQKK